jgi:chaperonin cofactor prefoldin
LLDGHNRLEICTKHGIAYQTVEKEFSDRADAVMWIIKNQFGRRNLQLFQRSELALKMKSVIAEKAKVNMQLSEGRGKKGLQNSDNLNSPVHTNEELAKLAGVSRDTINKSEQIIKKGTEEQKNRARTGGKGNTVNAIYNEIKRPEQAKCPERLNTETKVCRRCGRELPLECFKKGYASCNDCVVPSSPITDIKGVRITESQETRELANKYAIAVAQDIYDQDKIVEYTADDLIEEIRSLTDYYRRNIRACLANHSTLLHTNVQKITTALSEAEAVIKEMESLLS